MHAWLLTSQYSCPPPWSDRPEDLSRLISDRLITPNGSNSNPLPCSLQELAWRQAISPVINHDVQQFATNDHP